MRISLLSMLAALLAVGYAAASPAQEITTVYTQQLSFQVPFRLEPPREASQRPREVQLHVSEDQGRFWKLAERVDPTKGAFIFYAPHDGEYLFVVRTIDQTGRMLPETTGPTVPEMRVVVDTVLPQLEMQATAGRAGEVAVHWRASDNFIAVDRPTIEYQSTTDSPEVWHSVAVSPGLEGQATILVPAGSVVVRGRIGDRAGNESRCQVKVERESSAGVAASTAQPGQHPAANLPAPRYAANAAPENTRYAPPENSRYAPTENSRYTPTENTAPPANAAASNDLYDTTARLSREPVRPAVTNRTEVPPSDVPSGVTPQVVNTLRFALDYDVESVGPSGIGKVELWGTADAGHTWRRFGTDPDLRSPIEVSAVQEATYGFRMVVESGSGVGDKPPRSGDTPDIWVIIDTSKPDAQLLSIQSGADEQNAELVIKWEASDRQLASRPISLYFSSQASGQWHPIAAGLANTGSYTWKLGDRIPREVHIRMKVRDEAGNETMVDSVDAVMADRMRPRSRIHAAKPMSARAPSGSVLR